MVKLNLGHGDLCTLAFWRACLAELFGMVFFLISVCLVCVAFVKDGTSEDRAAANIEIGLGIGLSITTVAIMIGHVSGGHLNPAVSLGAIFAGRISIVQGLMYIPFQVIGAIAGSGIAKALLPADKFAGMVGVQNGLNAGQAFGCELLFTFVLVFFVLSVTDPAKKIGTYAVVLGIGICIAVCHLFLVPMTGCGINPARAFGPALIKGGKAFEHHWVYWIGPIVAAPLAAALYVLVFYHDKPKEVDASEVPMKNAEINGDTDI